MIRMTYVHEKREGSHGPMRQVVTLSLCLCLALFFMPAVLSGAPISGEAPSEPEATLPIDRVPDIGFAVETAARWDKGRAVKLTHADGTVEELTMAEYLWGVVAAEMPAAFHLEALKAQATAARTYTVRKQQAVQSKHPDNALCDDSSCCQAYITPEAALARWGEQGADYQEKIALAIAGTDGLVVTYGGSPIDAVFFSSAAGETSDAVEVWGNAVDYLVGVESPEGDEVPNYHSSVTFTPEQFKTLVAENYPSADLSGEPSGWLGGLEKNASGRVTGLRIGGVTLTGDQCRSLFSLRSATFDPSWDGNHFLFTVTGYGHGVGMSQYGANTMAATGSDFREILTWYYTGTAITNLADGVG